MGLSSDMSLFPELGRNCRHCEQVHAIQLDFLWSVKYQCFTWNIQPVLEHVSRGTFRSNTTVEDLAKWSKGTKYVPRETIAQKRGVFRGIPLVRGYVLGVFAIFSSTW